MYTSAKRVKGRKLQQRLIQRFYCIVISVEGKTQEKHNANCVEHCPNEHKDCLCACVQKQSCTK